MISHNLKETSKIVELSETTLRKYCLIFGEYLGVKQEKNPLFSNSQIDKILLLKQELQKNSYTVVKQKISSQADQEEEKPIEGQAETPDSNTKEIISDVSNWASIFGLGISIFALLYDDDLTVEEIEQIIEEKFGEEYQELKKALRHFDLYSQGYQDYISGNHEEALVYFKQIPIDEIEDPKQAKIIGICYQRTELYQSAIQYFEKGIALLTKKEELTESGVKQLVGLYNTAGRTCSKIEEFKKRNVFYEHSIALNPDQEWLYEIICRHYLVTDRYKKLIATTLDFIQRFPESEYLKEMYIDLGIAYHELSQYHRALEVYNLSITKIKGAEELSEEDQQLLAKAYRKMGFTYGRLKNDRNKCYYFEESLKLNPFQENIHSYVCKYYFNEKKYRYALEKMKSYLKKFPDGEELPVIYACMGESYFHLSNHSMAMEYANKSLRRDRYNARAHACLASVYHERKYYRYAIKHALEVTRLTKNKKMKKWAYIELGLSYQKLKDYKTALGYHTKAYYLSPYDGFNNNQIRNCKKALRR